MGEEGMCRHCDFSTIAHMHGTVAITEARRLDATD